MKSIFVCGLCLIAQFSPAHASSVEFVLKLQDELKSVYQNISLPPPEQLFDDEFDLREYYEAIRNGKCNMAILDLGTAFHKENPNLPNPHGFDDGSGLLAWNHLMMPRFYPELVFCRAMQSLSKRQQEIKEKNISGHLRFGQFSRADDLKNLPPLALRLRVGDVGELLVLTLFNYAPAQVALAALSAKGEAVRLTPAYAYFLLSRAKRLGYTASDLAPLLEKATAALSADERQQLTARIKSGDWPREERRVVD